MLAPTGSRFHYYIVGGALILLLIGTLHSTGTVTKDSFQHAWNNDGTTDADTTTPVVTTAAVAPPVQATAPAGPPLDKATIIDPLATGGSYNLGARPGPSFQEVALKYGTDKVTNHRYQFMYEKYLNPLQGRKLKMLEIGLGCNMNYGPGASYYTWLEYLPHVELYYIEYDKACAEKWAHKTDRATIFTGDQADVAFLNEFVTATTSGDQPLFDIVIDDGGHTMNQQLTSLQHLWKIVKPGGIYFIEDLQTSYWDGYGGDPSTKDENKQTMMKYIYELADDVMIEGKKHPDISPQVRSIDCMKEVCALIRKDEGSK